MASFEERAGGWEQLSLNYCSYFLCCLYFAAAFFALLCRVVRCLAVPCVPYRAVLCCVMPCCTVSCRAMPCHAAPCVVPCRAMPYRVVPCYTVPCRTMQCRAMPCRTVPCYAVPCYAVLYCALLRRAVPSCCTVSCRARPCAEVRRSLMRIKFETRSSSASEGRRFSRRMGFLWIFWTGSWLLRRCHTRRTRWIRSFGFVRRQRESRSRKNHWTCLEKSAPELLWGETFFSLVLCSRL